MEEAGGHGLGFGGGDHHVDSSGVMGMAMLDRSIARSLERLR
jgi:hypothetical protein